MKIINKQNIKKNTYENYINIRIYNYRKVNKMATDFNSFHSVMLTSFRLDLSYISIAELLLCLISTMLPFLVMVILTEYKLIFLLLIFFYYILHKKYITVFLHIYNLRY